MPPERARRLDREGKALVEGLGVSHPRGGRRCDGRERGRAATLFAEAVTELEAVDMNSTPPPLALLPGRDPRGR